MAGIKNILYPVDFTEHHSKVLPVVLEMVEKFEANLFVLHVVEDLDHYANFYIPHPNVEKMEQEIKTGSNRRLQEFVDKHLAQVKGATTAILSGDPAAEIVQYAEENSIDLIITATHGRKGLDHVIFGSVAENVVRNSPVPVLTINPYK